MAVRLGTAALCSCSNSASTALLMPSSPCRSACINTTFSALHHSTILRACHDVTNLQPAITSQAVNKAQLISGIILASLVPLCTMSAGLCMFPKGLHEPLVHSVRPILPESARVSSKHMSLLSSCSQGSQDVPLRCTNTFIHLFFWKFMTYVSWKSMNITATYTGLLFLAMLPAFFWQK